jgi:hypothetical protein
MPDVSPLSDISKIYFTLQAARFPGQHKVRPNWLALSGQGCIFRSPDFAAVGARRGDTMPDDKLGPEPRKRLVLANMLGKAEIKRRNAISRFQNVETMVKLMDGLSDDEAARYFQRVLDDAGAERQVVSRFVDAIRTARSAKPRQ